MKRQQGLEGAGPRRPFKQPRAFQERPVFCCACKHSKLSDQFSNNQLRKATHLDPPRCIECCIANKRNVNSTVRMRCCMCGQEKSSDVFTRKERRKGFFKARCFECFEKVRLTEAKARHDKENAERQKRHMEKKARHDKDKAERQKRHMEKKARHDKDEAERQKRHMERLEAERKAEMERKEKLKAQPKMPTFEIPEYTTCWNDEETTDEVAFKENLPSLDTLVGSYDLIFYYTICDDPDSRQNRKTIGTLEFKMNGEGELDGMIRSDESVKEAMWPVHHYDIKIRCKPSGDFEVTNLEEVKDHCGPDEVEGSMQVAAEQRAVRYMPEGDDYKDFQQNYAGSIQFKDVAEAQKVLKKYPCEGEPLLWLCNHMNMPGDVSSHIRGLATGKPQPVFVFEENDLFITIDWDDDVREPCSTVLVARRRP